MRICRLAAFLTLFIPSTTNALYASQVGQIDWHETYIGIPSTHSSELTPRFHKVGGYSGGPPAQALYLASTQKNVLAALNPSEGNIVWRHKYNDDDVLVAFKANMDGLVSLSGHGGATARIYEVINGNLIWEAHLHDPTTGHLAGTAEGEPTGAFIEFDSIDVFILSNGCTVRRLSGATGATMWGWTSPDMGSSTFITKLVRTTDALYAIGVTKGISSLFIHIVSLDPATGLVLHSASIPSSINSADDFYPIKIGANSNGYGPPRTAGLTWIEGGHLKQVLLTPSLEGKYLNKPAANKYGPYASFKATEVAEKGVLVALLEGKDGKGGAAHMYRIDVNGMGLNRIGEFEAPSDKSPYAVYAGGIDRSGRTYVAKIAHSSTLRSASYEVFVPDAIGGKGMSTGHSFEYDSAAHGALEHAAIDVVNTSEYVYVSRIIFTSSTGAIQQWQQETCNWTREESLTEIKAITAVDLPEISTDTHKVHIAMNETPLQRLVRQVGDIKSLPGFIFRFVQRFLTGAYNQPKVPSQSSNVAGSLWRDTYGFKKIVVAATATGKIFGIETSKGKIVWSHKLGAEVPDLRMLIKPLKMTVLKTVSDGFHPEVGLVIVVKQRVSSGILTTTGIVRIDATSGETNSSVMFRDPAFDTMELDLPATDDVSFGKKIIGIVDHNLHAHIFPYHQDAINAFNNLTDHVTFVMLSGPPSGRYLQGFGLSPWIAPVMPADADPERWTHPAPEWHSHLKWKSTFPPGENIVSIARQTHGVVASFGRVLGDRSTLYKYLNANLMAVLTETRSRPSHEGSYSNQQGETVLSCTIHLIDTSKGSVLYSKHVTSKKAKHADHGCDVKMSLTENWLVYHYYDDDSEGATGAKGWRMVSVELYEGGANVRRKTSQLSADSVERGPVEALEQLFIFPNAVKAMTTTSTKFGISSKDLIVINGKGQVQTYSRRLLDPRRPKTKPTTAEQEEGLFQYDVLLPDDPRRVVSHDYNLLVDQLLTTPTQLESTSLVLAYGIDLFMTRVTPSGTFDVLSENFNKVQLALTVGGLLSALLITRPLVRQKMLNRRWYS
ncbi:DUF1620-domain-containing protein [Serendipita vermifera]|nr:DUF1620-domain-containing protein [Serendipita vermifera]